MCSKTRKIRVFVRWHQGAGGGGGGGAQPTRPARASGPGRARWGIVPAPPPPRPPHTARKKGTRARPEKSFRRAIYRRVPESR